jgi:dolichol kinase
MSKTVPMAPRTTPSKPFQGYRKFYHVLASSLFPLFYLRPPFSEGEARLLLLWVTGSCFLLSFILDLLRLRDRQFNSKFMRTFSWLIRQSEQDRFNGSTFLCLAFFIVILLFPRTVAITAMLFLSLGDAAAELGGKHFGRLKLFGRSLEGTLAFFLVAFPVAYSLIDDWRVALLGALAGALVELFSFEVDDNLTVPIGSALALWLALLLFHLDPTFPSF